jgi:hypothetical protein
MSYTKENYGAIANASLKHTFNADMHGGRKVKRGVNMATKEMPKGIAKKSSAGLIGGTKLGSVLPKPAPNTSGTSNLYNPYTRKLQKTPSNYRT